MVDIERDTLDNVKYAKPEAIPTFQLTTYLMLAIIGCTIVTYAFQGRNEELWLLMTAPFNISIEGNIFGNVIVVLMIFGFAEFYLRETRRDKLIFDIFLSGILATYAVTFFIFFADRIVGAGTSIVGFSVLAISIFVIFMDLLTWMRRNIVEDKKYISILWIVPTSLAVVVFLDFLARFLFAAYIVSNQSAIFHVVGGMIAFAIMVMLLRVRGGGLIEPRSTALSGPA